MTRQRINVRIDRVTVRGGHLSERTLIDAIEAELGMRLHGLGSADLVRQSRLITVLDGGRITGGEGLDLSTGAGQAAARAITGVVKR